MKVSTKSWHGRAYKRWASGPGVQRRWMWNNPHRNRENLCHYVRVILFRRPLQWAIYTPVRGSSWLRPGHLFLLAATGFALGLGVVFAPGATWFIVQSILLSIVLVAAIGAAVVGVAALLGGYRKRRKKLGQPGRTEPTFRSVAWSWAKAKKRRICPFIDVVEEP